MATVERKLQVTYAGYTIGGPTDRILEGYHQVRKGFTEAEVTVNFVVRGDNDAKFAAACRAAEEAFRTPYADLTVKQGGANLLKLSHGGNTGFLARPEIVKADDLADTRLSRRYVATITFEMPADRAPTSGLRDSSVTVRYDPSRRRTVEIGGTVTAVPGAAARARYDAIKVAFSDAVLSTLGGTFELVTEDAGPEGTEGKILTFTRTYQEIIFAQGKDQPLDDPELVDQVTTIEIVREAPGDSPMLSTNENAVRPVTIRTRYEAKVDAEKTTRLSDKYDSIRTWLIKTSTDAFGSGQFAVLAETKELSPDENVIRATLEIMAVTSGALLSNTIEVEDDWKPGETLVGVWDGRRLAKYLFQGIADLRRTIRQTSTFIGVLNVGQGAQRAFAEARRYDSAPDLQPGGASGAIRWITTNRRTTVKVRVTGLPGYPGQITVTDVVAVTIREGYQEPGGGPTSGTPGLGGPTGEISTGAPVAATP